MQILPKAMGISVITLAELRYGAACSSRPEANHQAIFDPGDQQCRALSPCPRAAPGELGALTSPDTFLEPPQATPLLPSARLPPLPLCPPLFLWTADVNEIFLRTDGIAVKRDVAFQKSKEKKRYSIESEAKESA